MTIYNWSSFVNTRFYNYSHQRADNSIMTEMISGRKVGFQKNTRNVDTLSCSLLLTQNEDTAFWNWFDGIGGLAGGFKCSALGSANYRFTEVPSPSNSSQGYITLDLKIEELY